MQIRLIIIALSLFFGACNGPEKSPANKPQDTVTAKADTAKFNEPFVKSVYAKSDLVARIKVASAIKQGEIYIINAQLIETYKGQADKQHNIKYEAFLEEGDYKEFVGKELIIFLTTNKQDKKLYSEGIHWGRAEPNVEFAYTDSLKNFILNLK